MTDQEKEALEWAEDPRRGWNGGQEFFVITDAALQTLAAMYRAKVAERDDYAMKLTKALNECGRLSSELGEMQGKYEAAHWPGIVEGWKERTEAAESRLEQSSKDAMSAGYGQGYEAAMGVAIKRIDKLEAALKMAEDYLGRMSVREIGEINAVVVAVVLGEIESALAAQPAPEGERA